MNNSPSANGVGPLILRWEKGALTAGCVAWVLCVLGLLFGSPAQFFRAYLAAYTFCLGITLGGMAILMLSHLTGGAWAYLIRRILKAQMSTLPLMVLMFIPLVFGLEPLYLWARPELVAADPQLHAQQFWLNKPFFLIRAAIYFAIWLLIAFSLAARSRRQERTGDPSMPWKFMRLSEVGLVLYGTSIHFAAFDWLEMLQPNYHSTIFPLLVASSQLFSAQAFALVILATLSLRCEAASLVSTRVLIDLGNILLTFLIICTTCSGSSSCSAGLPIRPPMRCGFCRVLAAGGAASLGLSSLFSLPSRSFCC